jgi:hypothetical protein
MLLAPLPSRISAVHTCVSGGCMLGPGLEFIGMEEKDRARLNLFVTLQGGDPWATTYD